MRKFISIALFVFLAIAGLQAQIPAEVDEVMTKCRNAMNHPNGLEYTMDMKVSMGPVTLTNSKLVVGSRGDKNRSLVTMTLMGHELTFESGYDGNETWELDCNGNKDTIRITKGKKASQKGNEGINLDLTKDFKKAKMKLKDGYYEINYSDPIDKKSDIKRLSLKVSAKNYYLREMRTSAKGAKVTMTITKIRVGLNDNYFKLDLGKYPNAVIIRE